MMVADKRERDRGADGVSIGVWLNLSVEYFRSALGGLAAAVHQRPGWKLQVVAENLTAPWLREKAAGLRRIEAMVAVIQSEEQLEIARHISPIVINLSNRYFFPNLTQISTDEEAVGRMAANYFIERRFQHFAYYGGSGLNFSDEREYAFVATVRAAGGTVSVHYRSENEAALHEWLNSLAKPCAVFCTNDHFARRLIESATVYGIRVPSELSVVGVDDDTMERHLSPVPLSSVILDARGIGERIIELLEQHLIHGAALPHRLRIAPLGVASRQSSDHFRIEDPLVVRAMRVIHERVDAISTVKELAQALNVHRRTLEMHFRETTGDSVRTALLRARIERSKQLLLTTDMLVNEVMERSGFNNPRAFAAAFRQFIGQTPSAFRRGAAARKAREGD